MSESEMHCDTDHSWCIVGSYSSACVGLAAEAI